MSSTTTKQAAARDCRVPKENRGHLGDANCEEYRIMIDGETTVQNRMFNRGDMSFWSFTTADVTPPPGHTLKFGSGGEPHFEPMA